MNIAIYNPYWSILGGGEKYVAAIARSLETENHVTLMSKNQEILELIRRQFGINLEKSVLSGDAIFTNGNAFEKINALRKFDCFFYVTDGSLFFSPAKRNILIVQSPSHLPPNTLLNALKLRNWNIICYSEFISEIIYKRIGMKSIVLAPAVEDLSDGTSKKDKLIITVGRFFRLPHNKKQDILIKTFLENKEKYFSGHKFIIAGSLTEEGGKEYLKELKAMTRDKSIDFMVNPSYETLKQLYNKAKIYWHAAGFGEDLVNHPERAEHFGITTVEAMSAGAVPVVFGAGGQKEIIGQGECGFSWQTIPQLVSATSRLLHSSDLWEKMSGNAIIRAKDYSASIFHEKLKRIIS